MAPKKKPTKVADAKDDATAEVKPTGATEEPKKDPTVTAVEVQKPKPTDTKVKESAVVKASSTQPASTQPPKPTEVPKPTETKPATDKKDDNPQEPSATSVKRELTEAERIQLRKFKFTATEEQMSLDEAMKVRDERLKKFGGPKLDSKDELKKRAEKFGTEFVDKQELKELKEKRKEKFGGGSKPGKNDSLLPSEQLQKLAERKKKFIQSSAESMVVADVDADALKKRAEKFNSGAPDKKVKVG